MIENLKVEYPHIEADKCLKIINRDYFEICDHPIKKRCYIVKNSGDFKVTNSKSLDINFIAVDSCMLGSSDPKRCDCMLICENNIHFIELKTCKPKLKPISHNRTKAKKQLKKFIEFFIDKFEPICSLYAYICINCTNNSDSFTKKTRASNSDAELEFEDELNTKLSYECELNL